MKKLILILVLLNIFIYAQQDVNDAAPTITHSLPHKKNMVKITHDTIYRIVHDTVKVIIYKTIKPKPMLFTGKWIITNYGKEIPSGQKTSKALPVLDYNKLPNIPAEFETGLYSSNLDIKIILQLVKIKN